MIERLLKESRASDYKIGTINLVLLKGVNLYNSGKFDQALKVINEIEPEVHKTNNSAKLSRLYALKANS